MDNSWRESDKLAYTLGILRNRLDLGSDGIRAMSFHVRRAADAGVPWETLEDEARMAVYYGQYRQKISELSDD